jgi:hypothetical protein
VVALESFLFPFAAFFLPILDVTSLFTHMRSRAEGWESGAAHRGMGEVVVQLLDLDLDLEMAAALEQRKIKGSKQ